MQITSGADRGRNIAVAEGLVRSAAEAGARLIVLPEKWAYIHGPRTAEGAEPLDGPSVAAATTWARALDVAILAGSIIERTDAGRVHNTSLLIAPDGEVAGVYRKLHMFDVEVRWARVPRVGRHGAGSQIVVADVLGRDRHVGLLRPALPRALPPPRRAGCRILVVPAAFTEPPRARLTGTRCCERGPSRTRCFVIAAAQVGRNDDGAVRTATA